MNSRDKILQNIKKALEGNPGCQQNAAVPDSLLSSKINSPISASQEKLVELFQKELELVSGEFLRLSTFDEIILKIIQLLKENIDFSYTISGGLMTKKIAVKLPKNFKFVDPHSEKQKLAAAQVGIVDVEYAIADTGTLVVPFHHGHSSCVYVLPEIVIALVQKGQLIAHHFELFEKIDPEKAKNMMLITGPSRTADIEKILILGAHGPRRLIVYMLDTK